MIVSLIPQKAQRIIVAPLNWGLGHATRSIPIIKQLISAGKEVIIASDGAALTLLRKEFPKLTWEALPPYNVSYKHQSLLGIILSNAYNVQRAIIQEAKVCQQLVKKHQIDAVVSDSRFGFRSDNKPSYIISHQLKPYSHNKTLAWILERGNRHYLNRFDQCWVPDSSDHRLSGNLSINPKINNVRFIGPVSRLQPNPSISKVYSLTIILSGPEPARTVLEKTIIKQLKNKPDKVCLIRGTKDKLQTTTPDHWTIIDLADTTTVNKCLLQAEKIISRSGYTSIMDYAALGVGAYLIPTPGQSEQEYLAEYLDGKYGFEVYRGTL